MTTINIQIPTAAAVEAQGALKDAAWELAIKFARAESFKGHEFFSHLVPTDSARDEVFTKINGLMNAAATLDGRQPRSDWAESMIREAAIDVSGQ